jgi:hypothetical protein
MRIAQVSTVGTPVRQEGSDSIESLVWLLSRELTRLGHEVTVFAAAGSEVCGDLVATLPGPYGTAGAPDDWQLCEWVNLCGGVPFRLPAYCFLNGGNWYRFVLGNNSHSFSVHT